MKEPVYIQIAENLKKQIEKGELAEGERLPPERKLCDSLNVARNTVKQAYDELCRQGYAVTRKGSGTYVDTSSIKKAGHKIYSVVDEAITQLQQMGKGQHEIERMFADYAWSHLPEEEKLKLAWVDCSEELVWETAQEISQYCNIKVDAFLLDEIRDNPGLLGEERYDLFATTINHHDEVSETVRKVLADGEEISVEKVVLAVTNKTISDIARLQGTRPVAVVYGSEWYRYCVECFLEEFGVNCPYAYIPIQDCIMDLEKNLRRYQAVILPQNPEYGDGMTGKIAKFCDKKGVVSFSFEQVADQGSLLHLRKTAVAKWVEMGTM